MLLLTRLLACAALTLFALLHQGCAPALGQRLSVAAALTTPSLPDLSADGRTRLSATFYGATTIAIDDGSSALLIDGFFSRPSIGSLLARELRPDHRRIFAGLSDDLGQRLDAVFVGHAHHDHVMDSGAIGLHWSIPVYGSASVASVVRADGAEAHVLSDRDTVAVHGFRVTALATPHSPDDLAEGEVRDFRPPARVMSYRSGQNLAYLIRNGEVSILIVTSAGLEPDMFAGLEADVVFLSVGRLGRQTDRAIEAYWCEAVVRTGARLVVPTHWDDFTQKLARPLSPTPALVDDVDRAFAQLQRLARRDAVSVVGMDAVDRIDLERASELSRGRPEVCATRHASTSN